MTTPSAAAVTPASKGWPPRPERQALLNELAMVQNHPKHAHHDIMTFAGFLDDEELRQHIERNRLQGKVAR